MFIVECLLTLGIRMAELTRATMTDIHRERGAWWFRAIGKGNKERQVPAVERFMRSFQDYRLSIELPTLPATDEATMPLIQYVTTNNRGAISEYQIRKIVKPLLTKAADLLVTRAETTKDAMLQMDLHADAEKLRQATPHWFRHTYATNLHDAEVDPRIIKTCLGHASLDTTMIYSHTEAKARHEAIEKALSETT
ncbi:MAG: tyrosine-type recombinase/integrase [Gammaproteobacteria bacterium]|nr:tyrosine-type recombinase/integrase [Gammaproteobacteria bacterium]